MSTRILIREDGAVFPFSAVIAIRPNMAEGAIDDNGDVLVPSARSNPVVMRKVAKFLGKKSSQIKSANVTQSVVLEDEDKGDTPEAPISDSDPKDDLKSGKVLTVDEMNKEELEAYARDTLGIELDRRRKLSALVAEVKAVEAKALTEGGSDNE